VDAVYQTLAALAGKHPKLTGYAIKAITGGTDAQGEVTVQMLVNGRTLTGRGAHTDIVVASAKAYVNALNRLETGKPGLGKKSLKK
jgi:2-isopropylmalate synthase